MTLKDTKKKNIMSAIDTLKPKLFDDDHLGSQLMTSSDPKVVDREQEISTEMVNQVNLLTSTHQCYCTKSTNLNPYGKLRQTLGA